MEETGAHACTDVTGFGLLGHLREMAAASGLDAEIEAGAVPVLEPARELAAADVVPGGTLDNLEHVSPFVDWSSGLSRVDRLLLADAQTSGGLLIAVPPERTEALLAALRARGVTEARRIGRFTAPGEGPDPRSRLSRRGERHLRLDPGRACGYGGNDPCAPRAPGDTLSSRPCSSFRCWPWSPARSVRTRGMGAPSRRTAWPAAGRPTRGRHCGSGRPAAADRARRPRGGRARDIRRPCLARSRILPRPPSRLNQRQSVPAGPSPPRERGGSPASRGQAIRRSGDPCVDGIVT